MIMGIPELSGMTYSLNLMALDYHYQILKIWQWPVADLIIYNVMLRHLSTPKHRI